MRDKDLGRLPESRHLVRLLLGVLPWCPFWTEARRCHKSICTKGLRLLGSSTSCHIYQHHTYMLQTCFSHAICLAHNLREHLVG